MMVGVSYVAEQLPRCDLLKVSPRHKEKKKKKEQVTTPVEAASLTA